MTQEHVTITEEVQKDGQIVTQKRETLQTTVETPEQIAGRQAMGVTHPDFVPATERRYVYDEELGMSRSEPVPDVLIESTPEEIEDLKAVSAEQDSGFQPMSTEDDKPTTRRK